MAKGEDLRLELEARPTHAPDGCEEGDERRCHGEREQYPAQARNLKTTQAIWFSGRDSSWSSPSQNSRIVARDDGDGADADFTGDGKSDVLWHHATNGEVWVWLMDGATPLSKVSVALPPPDLTVAVYRMQ